MNNPVTKTTIPARPATVAHPGSSRFAPATPDAERLLPTPTLEEKRFTKRRKLPVLGTPGSTIHQDVVAALRDFIIRGELQPGARLPERALSERLSVSRTPLRESLRVLASEGLIELLPNRGARVAKMTPADLHHLFEVLQCLEACAGRLACERASDAEISEIVAIHRRMFTHFLAHRMPEYLDLNRVIHVRIVQAAHNPILESTYHSLSNRMLWACALSNQESGRRWEAAMNEHEQIIQALEQRSGERLATLLESHLHNKYQALAEQI
jgi:DNA-binding GntR family transcriptional regulator